MAIYRDGRQAQVGDTVRGRGHNVRYEFTGVVVRICPGQHLVLAHCGPRTRMAVGFGEPVAIAETEYGLAGDFELVVPAPPALGVLGS